MKQATNQAIRYNHNHNYRHINNHNYNHHNYIGFAHVVKSIIAAEGIGGIYKGVVPTVLKQASNQGIRFLVFSKIKNVLSDNGKKTGAWISVVSGAIAGAVSVYGNTPIDAVKNRMQGLEAKNYTSSWHCFTSIKKRYHNCRCDEP